MNFSTAAITVTAITAPLALGAAGGLALGLSREPKADGITRRETSLALVMGAAGSIVGTLVATGAMDELYGMRPGALPVIGYSAAALGAAMLAGSFAHAASN